MNDYFGKPAGVLNGKKLFLFDMDGTIYLDDKLFDGILEVMQKIVDRGGRYVFITNNSSKSVEDYIKKINKLGIEADEENFFTSTQASIMILKEKFGDSLIYCQGTRSFIKELKKGGLNVTEKYDNTAKAVLVGFDNELTMEKLRTTCKMLTENDVEYYATNPDWVCPVDFGFVPDCGSMCFGIEKATGKKPIFIGKPQPTMINTVMKKFGFDKEETVVIGDRLYTDIASGVNAGVDTVLVLCGESTLKDLEESPVKPTFTFEETKVLLHLGIF